MRLRFGLWCTGSRERLVAAMVDMHICIEAASEHGQVYLLSVHAVTHLHTQSSRGLYPDMYYCGSTMDS